MCVINMAFGTQMLDGGGGRGGARLTNLGPQAKSSPLPVFVNEVLLEGHVRPFTHYLWLILWYSDRGLSSSSRAHMVCET